MRDGLSGRYVQHMSARVLPDERFMHPVCWTCESEGCVDSDADCRSQRACHTRSRDRVTPRADTRARCTPLRPHSDRSTDWCRGGAEYTLPDDNVDEYIHVY
jgi:hypothetical protein